MVICSPLKTNKFYSKFRKIKLCYWHIHFTIKVIAQKSLCYIRNETWFETKWMNLNSSFSTCKLHEKFKRREDSTCPGLKKNRLIIWLWKKIYMQSRKPETADKCLMRKVGRSRQKFRGLTKGTMGIIFLQ